MLLLSRLICIRYERWITYERWVTFYSGLRINVLLIIPSLVIWLSFIVLIWVDHHSFHFLIALFYISSSLSRSSLHRLSIPYILTHISGSVPSTHHSHVSLIVWPLILLLVSISTFSLVTSKSITHEIFLCITSGTQGYGFDHWVFESSFLSFLSPYHLGLRYARVLRPPWGHEIRHYLWQFSLGQAFVDWLKYSRYYVLFYERYFWKHLVSLLLGILMFDGFLSLEAVHRWYWIHPFVDIRYPY